jgi:hypothetical protein
MIRYLEGVGLTTVGIAAVVSAAAAILRPLLSNERHHP